MTGLHEWGIHDWPQFYAWYEIPRRAILEYGQVPLWNPWLMGGGMEIGHPQSGFLSPFFLPVLLFGPVVGLKLAAASLGTFGLWGMWRLTRQLSCGRAAAFLAACLWGFNGWFASHLLMGHFNMLPFFLLPWVVGSYLRGRCALAGTFWALMFLSGGSYPFLMTGLFLIVLAVCLGIFGRSASHARGMVKTMVWGLGLSAVKLIPALDFMAQWDFIYPDYTAATPAVFLRGLFDRHLPLISNYREGLGSWEYSAYVGATPLLALLGIRFCRSALERSLLVAGAIGLLLAWGDWGLLSPYRLFFSRLPILASFHVPYRFIVLTLFSLSILLAMQLTSWSRGSARRGILLWMIACGVTADLLFVSHRLFGLHAPAPPPSVERQEQFSQRRIGFTGRGAAPEERLLEPYARQTYVNLLQGCGAVDGYDPIHLPVRARAEGDPDYRGEVFLNSGSGEAILRRFTPNTLILEVEALQEDILLVNQNFQRGWRVMEGPVRRVVSVGGLIGVPVPAGRWKVQLSYAPWSVPLGMGLSGFSVLLALWRWRRARRIARATPSSSSGVTEGPLGSSRD